jgi:hypothetical protein
VNVTRILKCLSTVLVLSLCILGVARTALAVEPCTDYKGNAGHLITFINQSGEDVVIGVYGTEFNLADQLEESNPFKGYHQSPDNWSIASGGTITWCAAKHFNGRFFARTGCSNGKCKTGNCCKTDNCPGNVCDKGVDPTSMAEVFFDSKVGTYFDISLVDGYDFPLLMEMVNTAEDPEKPRNCSKAGCTNLPDCPWPMVDGVCRAPYRQIILQYQDYKYRPEYYPLAAACAQEAAGSDPTLCGCGLTPDCVKVNHNTACPTTVQTTNPYTEKTVTLTSSGCSPINQGYGSVGEEKNQIACDPMQPDDTKTFYGTACHPWPAPYKQYVENIENTCKNEGVYTWQYSDNKGGRDCNNTDDLGSTITVLPRKKSGPQADFITIAPGKPVDVQQVMSGNITMTDTAGVKREFKIVPPELIYFYAMTGDKLNVNLKCPGSDYSFSCELIYTSGIGFDAGSNVKCGGYAPWSKSYISFSPMSNNDYCTIDPSLYQLQISPSKDLKGHVCIGTDATPKSFSPSAKPPITVILKDKDLFRIVESCGNDTQGKSRNLSCSADFSLTNGFTARHVDGQSAVCTDGRINWNQVFSNHNLGIGLFNPDADCVPGDYTESCPTVSYLYGAFTGAGIWKWSSNSWSRLTPDTPEGMAAGAEKLYGDFGGNGLWQWSGSVWSLLTPDNPVMMVASGTDLYGTFAGTGIWKWSGSSWSRLTLDTPTEIAASGSYLYGIFSGNGIWKWSGSSWSQLTTNTPLQMAASEGNLYGIFSENGLWKWNGSSWSQLTPDTPASLAASGNNLYGIFEGNGVWQWNGSSWSKLTLDTPARMAASGNNLYGIFKGNGVWQWNGTNWALLTPDNPALLTVGE